MRHSIGRFMLAAAMMAGSWAMPAPALANLITNGSFEGGPAGTFTTLAGGSTAITGWTVTGHSVDWINNYWQPSNGSFSVDLNGSPGGLDEQGGLLSDQVATIAGRTYVVTFDMAGNPDGLPDLKTLRLTAGLSSQLFFFDASGTSLGSMGWQTKSLIFTADAPFTSLLFESQDAGWYGPALDNVSMEQAVPEPGTLLLLGSGISALALRRRRKA